MKKSIAFLGLVIANFGIAQCNISGGSHISVDAISQYSVENELAQCKQCHQWSVSSNAQIVGDSRENKVSIKGISNGNATVSLQYLSPQGLVKCSREVTIVGESTAIPSVEKKNEGDCDISLENFREVKLKGDMVLLYPDTKEDLVYFWEANYKNGMKETSSEKTPEFKLQLDNPIVSVQIKVFSKSCYKTFTKTYESNFWKFLK